LAGFTTTAGTIQNLEAVPESSETAITTEDYPTGTQFRNGFFSFNITGLTQGAGVELTITLPYPVAPGSLY